MQCSFLFFVFLFYFFTLSFRYFLSSCISLQHTSYCHLYLVNFGNPVSKPWFKTSNITRIKHQRVQKGQHVAFIVKTPDVFLVYKHSLKTKNKQKKNNKWSGCFWQKWKKQEITNQQSYLLAMISQLTTFLQMKFSASKYININP